MLKESEPVALFDMDSTLCDFDSRMAELMRELANPHEENPVTGRGEDGKIFPWLRARRAMIKKIPGFWRDLEPLRAGFEILRAAQRADLEPHVLTKGPEKSTNAWTEKVEWCQVHIPGVPITVSMDKGLVYGRVLVDDWPDYVERWLEWRPRGLVVMVDWPHNSGFSHPNVFRYRQIPQGSSDWGSQMAQLERQLEKAAAR
jgi:hypothetical protein